MQPSDLLAVDAQRGPDGAIRLQVRGELDLYTAPELKRAIVLARHNCVTCIELDLAGLSFVDVRGARELVSSGYPLTNVPAHIRRVLELTYAPSVAV